MGLPLPLPLQWKTHPVLKSHLFDFGVQNLLVEQTSEHTWDALGRSFSTIWDALKRFWTISGTLGALLGHSRVPLGHSGGPFGTLLGALGCLLDAMSEKMVWYLFFGAQFGTLLATFWLQNASKIRSKNIAFFQRICYRFPRVSLDLHPEAANVVFVKSSVFPW